MSNVPKLRFKEFSGENRVQELKELVVSNTYGPRFNANDYDDNGNVKTIRGTDVTLDGTIKYNQVPTAKLDEKFIKSHILEDGDLVMITTADCGLTGIFEEQDEKYICSAYAVKITLNKSLTYPHYFKYFFQTALAKNEVNKYIRKATVANLPASDILRFSHRLPSKKEQEKIALFLTSVDTKIEQLVKKEKLLQQYKKGLMQKIFNQEIRFKTDDGSEFPELEEKKLSSLCNIKKGSQLNKDTLTEIGNHPAINGGINPSGYTTEYNTDENTITISEGGNSCGYVNFITTKFWSGGHNYSLQDLKKDIENLYLFQYLKHNENSIMRLRVGSGLPNIQKNEISNFKVLVPTIEEQEKIASFLSSIDTKIEQVQNQLEQTKEFKKALLQQMFV